jgi:flagellar motor switch protein FliM
MTRADVTPTSLFKEPGESVGSEQIESVGARLARGLQELLCAASGRALAIKPGSVNAASYTEWRIAQNPHGMLLRYRITAQNAQILINVPGTLISQIVDLAYGGNGLHVVRPHFTPAETRFVQRIAEQLVPIIRSAWDVAPSITPSLVSVETDLLNAHWPKAHDRILLHSFLVDGEPVKPASISWMIASETAKAIPSGSTGSETIASDPVWRQRMTASAMAVRMPARSVLTQCEMPLTKLLHLAPGDVIPIFLPSAIPLIVAGRTFARGSMGEANGRAALRIETIEKGA